MAARVSRFALICIAIVLTVPALPSQAIILATEFGTENNSKPTEDDFGWDNMGLRGFNTVTYIGDGWVLTAGHVGIGDVWFPTGNVVVKAVTSSMVTLENSPGVNADLEMWRLVSDPGRDPLTVATAPPPLGAELVWMGAGRNRGNATFWDPPGPPFYDGWIWGTGEFRWGTNRLESIDCCIAGSGTTTQSLVAEFTLDQDTDFEGIATPGDSGGGVFYKTAGGWELVGIMHAVITHLGQPNGIVLEENETAAADLSHFASQIALHRAVRACSDGTDDDGDGFADYPLDPGCTSASDAFETDAAASCDDGFDDDGDGLIDMADPGCGSPLGIENPACDDDLDNDGDGKIDWDGGSGGGTADPQCNVGYKNRESLAGAGCGLGMELALVVPLLGALRRRRQPRG